MPRKNWYILQVQPGQEQRTCDRIQAARAEAERAPDPSPWPAIRELFSPRFRTQKKLRGQWRDVERPLMPGYLVVVTDNPGQLARCLRTLPVFCQLLASGQTYVPLTDYERTWIESYTEKGNRVVPMSFGYREGDMLVVTEGPLVEREGRIVKVDRANSLAFLELHVGQIKIRTTVGLGIINEAVQWR